MGRAPCCEKMGLKKGPWTSEEDRILIDYIQLYGHGNWRALPKQAGLLRCGKSCRLRWINYLRPDLKRGNFTREEEDTIIKLHEMLGNRWSAIAARLPGRTDNEIKNVWHTHLKKRLKLKDPTNGIGIKQYTEAEPETVEFSDNTGSREEGAQERPFSPQQYSSDISSSATTSGTNNIHMKVEPWSDFPEIDESFWSEVLSSDNSRMASDLPEVGNKDDLQLQVRPCDSDTYDSMDFWYSIFTGAEELPEI